MSSVVKAQSLLISCALLATGCTAGFKTTFVSTAAQESIAEDSPDATPDPDPGSQASAPAAPALAPAHAAPDPVLVVSQIPKTSQDPIDAQPPPPSGRIGVSLFGSNVPHNGSVSLGIVPLNFSTEPADFVVTNTSDDSMLVETIAILDADGSFVLVNFHENEKIPGGESLKLKVKFEPKSHGPKTALLLVKSSDPETPEYTPTLTGSSEWGSAFLDGNDPVNGINFGSNRAAETPVFFQRADALYTTWDEQNASGAWQVRVSKFSGDYENPAWLRVDGGGANGINYSTGSYAYYPTGAVFNGISYIAWQEHNVNWKIRVKANLGTDEAPNWQLVDGGLPGGLNLDSTKNAQNPVLETLNGRLYIVWVERNSANKNQLRVAVFNSDVMNPSWSMIDGAQAESGLNVDPLQNVYLPIPMTIGGVLYIAWYEYSAASLFRVHVKSYNGNDATPAWTLLSPASGLNHDAGSTSSRPALQEYQGAPVVVWREADADDPGKWALNVSLLSGAPENPLWIRIGQKISKGLTSSGDTNGMNNSRLISHHGRLYVLHSAQVDTVYKVRLKVFNGDIENPEWSAADGLAAAINRDPAKNAYAGDLAVFQNRIFATWYENGLFWTGGGKDQVRVSVGAE